MFARPGPVWFGDQAGWRIFDLATYLWAVGWDKESLKTGCKAFLQAYQQARPLKPAEKAGLPAMMAARHLRWMGFQASLAKRLPNLASPASHRAKLRFLRHWKAGKIDWLAKVV